MVDNHILAHIALISFVAMLRVAHVTADDEKTQEWNVAVEVTKQCIDIESRPNYLKKELNLCLQSLEPTVWKMIALNYLNIDNCKADKSVKRAWCTKWKNFQLKSILITNDKLVEYISAPAWNKPPMPKPPKGIVTKTTIPASLSKSPMRNHEPSFSDVFLYKMSKVVDEVKDEFGDLKDKAEEKIMDTQFEIDQAQRKMKKSVDKANKKVDKLQHETDKKFEKAKELTVLHAKFTGAMAEEVGKKLKDTAKLTFLSAKELGKTLDRLWKDPIKVKV